MTVTPHFRLATTADAAALSQFGAETFIDWYLPDNDPADVELHVRKTYTPERQTQELQESGQWVLIADVAGRMAGYGMLRADTPCPGYDRPGLAEVRRFYVAREWHGTGVAHHMMHALMAHAVTVGAQGAWLTCWERNPRALAFYAKHGFGQVGITTFTVGTDVQTDHLLARTLP